MTRALPASGGVGTIRPLRRTSDGCYESANGRYYFWRDDNARSESKIDGGAPVKVRRWDAGRIVGTQCEAIESFRLLGDAVDFIMAIDSALPLCVACRSSIGGAHGGPDAPWRAALPGEDCGAADHDAIARAKGGAE